MKTKRKRLWAFLFLSAAIVAIILLAAGFGNLELSQGRPLSRYRDADEALLPRGWVPGSEGLSYLYMALYFLVVLLLPFSIIYVIISPEARRQVLRGLGLLLWILALYLVMRARPDLVEMLQGEPPKDMPGGEVALPDVAFVANPPQWIVWGTTLLLALLVAVGLVAAAWYVWRRTRRPEGPLEQLALEAQEALDALRAGTGLKDTVMRCYFEMGRVLMVQKGIIREETMTSREFEIHLAETGLPERHVRQLTRLFEDVRYGAQVPDERQELEAMDCLAAVVEVCKGSP